MFYRFSSCFLVALCIVLPACGGGSDQPSTIPSRILGGEEISPAAIPQLVQLNFSYIDGSSGLCSGAVIGPQEILTAGHCVESGLIRATANLGDREVEIISLIQHPQYQENFAVRAIFNDVAIAKTSEVLSVLPLPLFVSQAVTSGMTLTVYGYGTNEKKISGSLKTAQTLIETATPNHFFTVPYQAGGANTCHGDSGGPALSSLETEEGGLLSGIVGITSTGTRLNCAEGDQTLYANIQGTLIINFILQHAPLAQLL